MMKVVLEQNQFYQNKMSAAGFSSGQIPTLDCISDIPYTTKQDLVTDQAITPPFGTNFTFPIGQYTRIHQTSGTTGRPIYWLDTPDSWDWWLRCWMEVYDAAGVTPEDRIFLAFSFGPFIGFWSAFGAGQKIGALMISGGGLSSKQRLETMHELQATVLVCTPTYALRLAEIARDDGLSLEDIPIRISIHAGEPGASIPNVKARIESAWSAPCLDHAGSTEVGAWGYGCGIDNRMHINEHEFFVEVIDPETLGSATVTDGGIQRGELVLTNLGRIGSPLIRYRTGDLVEMVRDSCECDRHTAYLLGAVLGRVDSMIIVRGINIFPSALENIIREFEEIVEFEVAIQEKLQMADLLIKVEISAHDPQQIVTALAGRVHQRLNLKPNVKLVDPMSLPRYELKSRRFRIDY